MDLTSNDIYYLIKKKIKEKNDKNKKQTLPSISLTKRAELLKQLRKEENNEDYQEYFKGIILNKSNIINFLYNSINPNINKCFQNLEYLSITNNYLINLNFIISIPDLFYLDVYGNPLDDFNSLNYKNIFGYLRLSVDKFHENKILVVKGLNCAILDIEMKDKGVFREFNLNNPNILMLNNEINYYVDKLASNNRKIFKTKKSIINNNNINDNKNNDNKNNDNNLKKNKNLNMNFNDFLKKIEKEENDSQNNSEKSEKEIYNTNEDYKINNNSIINNNINIKIEIKKNNLLEIKNYFEELNQVLAKIKKKLKSKIKVTHLYNDDLYINIEKKRILLLYKTYLKLSIFNNEKNTDYFFCKNINYINNNTFTDEIRIYEIKQYIKCININIRYGIIILITILFYCLNFISMKLSISIIHYILLTHYKFDEHKQIPNFNSFGQFHYLCYYIDIYEDFKKKLIFAEKSQIDLYQKILDILEVKKLILKSNFLKKKKDENENKNNNLTNDNSLKNKVSYMLLLMKELKIDKDILILIEFFCDFIKYENMEQVVINGSLNDEYSTLIEIKEILEQIELDKNNLCIKDLSNQKYYKNKLERIFNKFYFENKKIKVVKNKNFKNLENNKINLNSKNNLLSFILNWNKDYIKTDQISIKNCFSIDKLIKKKTIYNYINKTKSNFKEKDFCQNICFSESKRNLINQNKANLNKNNFKNENQISKTCYKTISSINSYNQNKNNKTSKIKSTVNILNVNKDNKDNNLKNIDLFNYKSNTFRDIFKYFDNGKINKRNRIKIKNIYNKTVRNTLLNDKIVENNLKNYRNIIQNEEIKKNNYYNTLNNEGSFPFNTFNKEDARLKIKQIDSDIVNVNAHRLYWKKKYSNSRENILNYKENFRDGLFIEKYNQAKQAKIISKILEDKNRKIQEKLKEINIK